MKQQAIGTISPFMLIVLTIAISMSSCHSLEPIVYNKLLQTITKSDLAKFNGDYEIFSVDSSFTTSAFALAYSDDFDFRHLPKAGDRISLYFTDDKNLRVKVYKNGDVVKTKVIKGHLTQNYFEFKLRRFSTIPPFYFLLNTYVTRTNRIGLLQNGNLTLDTRIGGFFTLIIMPAFGSEAEIYNLIFRRRGPGNN